MSYKDYLPHEENKLVGIYKVSFEIQVGSDDELALSDVAQALTEGLGKGFGETFVEKVAELSVEKITKKAVKTLKIGDTVLIKEPVQVKSMIFNDDGYYFVGIQNEISDIVGENIDLTIESGSIGYVNAINKNGSIEVADLDRPITKFAGIGIDAVNVDLITVKAEQLEKIDSEEVK
jgi:hypothetical protein